MKKLFKKWWFWLIIIFLIVGFLNVSNNNSNMINVSSSNQEKITFLSGTNGKEFFQILCDIANIEAPEGTIVGDSIDYVASNLDYGIEIETNKNNEINWISIYTLSKSNYENFFLSIARLEYNGSDKSKCFNWIKENLGKESIIKIGDANLKLCNGTSGLPILALYTDGNENYQKEQIDKISK